MGRKSQFAKSRQASLARATNGRWIRPEIQPDYSSTPTENAETHSRNFLDSTTDELGDTTVANSKPVGRRLWTMSAIEKLMTVSCLHGQNCQNPLLRIFKESRVGLQSSFRIRCDSCNTDFECTNETDDCSLGCNRAAVWAGNATGTGYTDLKHSMAVLDVPFLSANTYAKLEAQFENEVAEVSYGQLIQNGREEKRLAEELGRVDPDGVVWTEVQGDAAWSKRSYNQRGNSLSGSAVIIGLLTGKPLFADVRNNYCYICKAKRAGESPAHQCFMNFDGSASAMEADIIMDGFKRSLQMHNLRYKTYLGDFD